MTRFRRRDVLKAGAAVPVWWAAGCPGPGMSDGGPDAGLVYDEPTLDPDAYDDPEVRGFDAEGVTVDEAVFSLGVSAGVMRATSAVFAGHIASDAAHRLLVWRDGAAAGEIKVVADLPVARDEDHNVRVPVNDLAPGTWYRYALFSDDLSTRSVIGRVKTAYPDDWRWPVTVGAMTCTNFRNQPYTALEVLADEEVDVLVHLGDMSYNDGATTRPAYGEKWRQTLADPGYRAVLPTAGLYYTWDDHEIANNLNPEELDPDQLRAARESLHSHVPAARDAAGELFTSFRWGHTVEFIVLDSRSRRTPSRRNEDVGAYLGADQHAWLKQRLAESPCHFKVVLNSVPVTEMTDLWLLQGDRWQGYRPARDDLMGWLEQEDVRRVIFLSGDFHIGFAGRVCPEGYGARLYEVAVGPSGNLGNPLGFLAEDPELRPDVFPDDQFFYGRGKIAATMLTFDPIADEVRVVFKDGNTGEVLYDGVLDEF